MTDAAPELGISLTLTSGRSPGELGTLAADAERAGFSTVLVTERVGDVFALKNKPSAEVRKRVE